MSAVSPPSNVKNAILAFAKNLVSKTMLKAFKVILNPCCTNTIAEVSVECVETGVYTVTVTTTNSIGYLGTGTAFAIIDGVVFSQGTITEPKTIVFEDIAITDGTYTFQVYTLLQTATGATSGVFQNLGQAPEDPEFVAC